MIKKIEKAKSGRSNCADCKEKIAQGDWRGIEEGLTAMYGKTYKSNKFYCKRCSIKKINEAIVLMNQWLEDFKKGQHSIKGI